MSEIQYPQEFIGSETKLVYKDGKKYWKIPHYKLAYFTYEEVKHQPIELPEKKPDIINRRH